MHTLLLGERLGAAMGKQESGVYRQHFGNSTVNSLATCGAGKDPTPPWAILTRAKNAIRSLSRFIRLRRAQLLCRSGEVMLGNLYLNKNDLNGALHYPFRHFHPGERPGPGIRTS
jgi:hypothetical protein